MMPLIELPAVYLWLDDERPAPDGWRWCKSVAEAKAVFEKENVELASLDYDLSPEDAARAAQGRAYVPSVPSGYDLLLWMQKYCCWPRQRPIVHSRNEIWRPKMAGFVEQYWVPVYDPELRSAVRAYQEVAFRHAHIQALLNVGSPGITADAVAYARREVTRTSHELDEAIQKKKRANTGASWQRVIKKLDRLENMLRRK